MRTIPRELEPFVDFVGDTVVLDMPELLPREKAEMRKMFEAYKKDYDASVKEQKEAKKRGVTINY